MQFRPPFAVKYQYTEYRCERQYGVETRCVGGDFTHIHNVMLFVVLFVQIALPEEMRDGHADNGRNGNR